MSEAVEYDHGQDVPNGSTATAITTTENSEPVPGPPGTEDVVETYGDIHKLVLQGFMAAGYLDAKGVRLLFNKTCEYLGIGPEGKKGRTDKEFWQAVVRQINNRIEPFDMLIRSAGCEFTGKKYYVFLVNVGRPIMRLQTLFSKFELELFQRVMDKILRKNPTFSLPLTECINVALEIDPRPSLAHAEKHILKMIDINYFTNYKINLSDGTETEEVTLGFRSMRELEPILMDMYSDVVTTCNLCRLILLHGLTCQGCKNHVHKPCFDRFQPLGIKKQCLECKISWLDDDNLRPRRRTEVPVENGSPGTEASANGTKTLNPEDTTDEETDEGLCTNNEVSSQTGIMHKLEEMTLSATRSKNTRRN